MFKHGDICKTVLRPNDSALIGTSWAQDCIVTIHEIERGGRIDEEYGAFYEVKLITGQTRWGDEILSGCSQYIYECNLVLISHQPKAISGFAKFQKTITNA